MFERAISPEMQDASNALSAAADLWEVAAGELKDDLLDRLRDDASFAECVNNYCTAHNLKDLRALLDKWTDAERAHRSASNAFLKAFGRTT